MKTGVVARFVGSSAFVTTAAVLWAVPPTGAEVFPRSPSAYSTMSVLPQLTFSTGCQLPPAAPSSLFDLEENSSAGAAAAKTCSGNSGGKKSSSESSNNSKSRAAAGLRGMKAAEETLQWLAARVLQQAPPPHMLPLGEVFDEILRLDAAAASHALLQITRNVAKVLQASRFLFVGSRAACQQCLAQCLEEEQQRAAGEEQEQQKARRRQVEEREWQQHNNDKAEKRWDGEEAVTSWEEHADAEGKVKSEEDEEDTDDWSCVPVRDEQSSCFPWLMPNAAVAAAVEARVTEVSFRSNSAELKKHGQDKEEDLTALNGDAAGDHLFVLLQPVSPAEEAFGCPDVLIKLCHFLSVQDVISIGRVCRATVAAALSEDVWMPLLHRSFPKASLVNEDVLENAEEQQRIDQEKHKQIVDDMLVRIPPDKPVRLAVLLLSANKTLAGEGAATTAGELRLRMDAEALLHLISCHPDSFRQDAAGQQFVVQPSRLYSDWLPVNPYAVAEWGPERVRHLQQETHQLWREEQCEAGAVDLKEEQQEGQPIGQCSVEDSQKQPSLIFRRELSARQAYRLWHTKLLGAEQNRERPWEYFNACSEISSATKSLVHKRGLLLPAGALLDLCERRLRFVRLEDPMTVHTLVLRTIDGIMYHIPAGCFNRRVNLLQQALCSPHLRLERETRKRIERRLLDFMQHVRDERKFGFFACRSCGSRWRSGFTYDEIAQQCLRCGLWNKAFKCQPLLSGQDFNFLQKSGGASLRQQQHQPGAPRFQQHQLSSTPQHQQHDVRQATQNQQEPARNLDPTQQQGGRQHQHGGGRRQENQRPRQQQQRSAPERSQPSSALLQQRRQSGDAAHEQSCGTERGQPWQQPCTGQSHPQQPRFSSWNGHFPQQHQRGAAQSRQRHKGFSRRICVEEPERQCVDVRQEGRPRSLPGAGQDRQQVPHIQEQGTHQRRDETQQRDRPTGDQQETYRAQSRQGVQPSRELAQKHDRRREPLLRSLPHVPPDLSSRRQATPEAIQNGLNYAKEAVGYSSTRRPLAKGHRQGVHWSELQHPERKQKEKDCLHRPVSQDMLLQGLQQQRLHQDVQQYQSQSQTPSRRNVERTKGSRSVREDRRDVVPNASSYDSRSELVRRVLQQQLRAAAREDR